MKWLQYKLTTTPQAVDAISYRLLKLGIQGIEIEDGVPLSNKDKEIMYVDFLDEPTQKDKDTSYMSFYLSEKEDKKIIINNIKKILKDVSQYLYIGKGIIETKEIDEKDWANNWKKYFKPFRVDKNIIIKPSWEEMDFAYENDIILELDPGMAFGTGTHETTSLCINMINKYIQRNLIVYDIGCGSGVLGIAAAKLGASKVICTDIDPNAVAVAKENINKNKVSSNVSVKQGDLVDTINEKSDIVVANILADVIIKLTENIKKVLKTNGLFIMSGIILEKVKEVKSSLIKNGLSIIETKEKGEWAVIVAKNME
ncbi:MAG: 50S ribosomal protein L11 methyltransferase [Eubacteriales bacterium]